MTSNQQARQARIDALKAHAAARSAKTDIKLDAALRALIKQRVPISVAALSRESKVVRAAIYNRPELVQRISSLRAAHRPMPAASGTPISRDNTIIAALTRQLDDQQATHRKELATLRTELRHTKDALAAAQGALLAASRPAVGHS